MIVSIRHKGLRLLWEKNDASKLPADQIRKIRLILDLLNAATKAEDMGFAGADLHKLKGDLKEFWAVKVNANYRIIFRFEQGEAADIDYLDYH